MLMLEPAQTLMSLDSSAGPIVPSSSRVMVHRARDGSGLDTSDDLCILITHLQRYIPATIGMSL